MIRPFALLLLLPQSLLFQRLDPQSIPEHLSYYHLYPDTPLGKEALNNARKLLSQDSPIALKESLHFPTYDLTALMSLITRPKSAPPATLPESQLTLIEELAQPLANRRLQGHHILSKQTLDSLPIHEIDLARGLLINQYDGNKDKLNLIRTYEAILDLMALQIRARLPDHPTHQDKVSTLNAFIFHEMNYRFPPHSLYAKNIDHYSFLPTVLDNRQGVCLGVSILYLCIAQRIGLPLEIITPPGHIYIRLNEEGHHTNIETTARGIHVPTDSYLSINTRKLPQRTLREVLGMVYYNHASLSLQTGQFNDAIPLYEKAKIYMKDDPQLNMLLGICYYLSGHKKEGKKLLNHKGPLLVDEAVSPETLPQDLLTKKATLEGIQAIFAPVDDRATSIQEKQAQLHSILKKTPEFSAGWFHLATTHLQLGQTKEASQALTRYIQLSPDNITAHYYLAILALKQLDYNKAWTHLNAAQDLATARHHSPKTLHDLKHHLTRLSPPPLPHNQHP